MGTETSGSVSFRQEESLTGQESDLQDFRKLPSDIKSDQEK